MIIFPSTGEIIYNHLRLVYDSAIFVRLRQIMSKKIFLCFKKTHVANSPQLGIQKGKGPLRVDFYYYFTAKFGPPTWFAKRRARERYIFCCLFCSAIYLSPRFIIILASVKPTKTMAAQKILSYRGRAAIGK